MQSTVRSHRWGRPQLGREGTEADRHRVDRQDGCAVQHCNVNRHGVFTLGYLKLALRELARRTEFSSLLYCTTAAAAAAAARTRQIANITPRIQSAHRRSLFLPPPALFTHNWPDSTTSLLLSFSPHRSHFAPSLSSLSVHPLLPSSLPHHAVESYSSRVSAGLQVRRGCECSALICYWQGHRLWGQCSHLTLH